MVHENSPSPLPSSFFLSHWSHSLILLVLKLPRQLMLSIAFSSKLLFVIIPWAKILQITIVVTTTRNRQLINYNHEKQFFLFLLFLMSMPCCSFRSSCKITAIVGLFERLLLRTAVHSLTHSKLTTTIIFFS